MSEPTDEDLETIKTWKIASIDDCHALMEYVRRIWTYPDMFTVSNKKTYRLVTGGWSDNEAIISAMESNILFWCFFWESSTRGGLHLFGKCGDFK